MIVHIAKLLYAPLAYISLYCHELTSMLCQQCISCGAWQVQGRIHQYPMEMVAVCISHIPSGNLTQPCKITIFKMYNKASANGPQLPEVFGCKTHGKQNGPWCQDMGSATGQAFQCVVLEQRNLFQVCLSKVLVDSSVGNELSDAALLSVGCLV